MYIVAKIEPKIQKLALGSADTGFAPSFSIDLHAMCTKLLITFFGIGRKMKNHNAVAGCLSETFARQKVLCSHELFIVFLREQSNNVYIQILTLKYLQMLRGKSTLSGVWCRTVGEIC